VTQVFIISGTSWTVPADWNSADNSIETIGGGAGGSNADVNFAGSGGGGGAYSKVSNLAGLSGTLIVQVGSAGLAGTAGGDTWFNGALLAASSVGAKGGVGGGSNVAGTGGDQASCIGTTKFSGGNGAASGANCWPGAGGGGAAGPNGAGAAGSLNDTQISGGGGGGGNGNGATGGAGDSVTGNGGSGGNGNLTTGGGVGDTGSGAGNGTAGTGGGGGGAKYQTFHNGGNGATGSEFDGTHGSGGGGGGGGGRSGAAAGNGGTGANYGGGGGGGGYPQIGTVWGTGGVGGPGIIVVTYTPRPSTTITAESWAALDFHTTWARDNLAAIEFGLTARAGNRPPLEASGRILRSVPGPIEYPRIAPRYTPLPIEGVGAIAVTADALMLLEVLVLKRSDTVGLTEFGFRTLRDAAGSNESLSVRKIETGTAVEHFAKVRVDLDIRLEWANRLAQYGGAPNEILAALSHEAVPVLELLTRGTRIAVAGVWALEWADPPGLVLVSPGRVLRSPGRIRILAGPGSMHPLRGQ
jgi:hypothetical protein